MKFLTVLLSFLVFVSAPVDAAAKDKEANKKIDMKCYVSMHSGANTIVTASIRKKQIPKLPSMLAGRNMLSPLSEERITVYKVNECVPISEKFSSRQANMLDKDTPK